MNTESFIENDFLTASSLVRGFKRHIEEIASKDGICGIPSGFIELDRLTSGFQPSDLIIIAARTGMGKSSFALNLIRNMSIDFGIPILLFSPEMSATQIIQRLISNETKLSLHKLRSASLEKHEWEILAIKTRNLEKAPVFIDDTPSILINEICRKTESFVIEEGVKIIFIDNLHLISAGNKENGDITREQEVSIITRKLKALAKKLNITVIALSQLSREVENRGFHKRPILSDLRGSGTLEEIADIVSFIYRPEYYKIDEWDDEFQNPSYGQAELIIAKNRNGGLENIRLKFIQNIGMFDNLDDFSSPFNDLPSKMKFDDQQNPFSTPKLPSPNEAFGSSSNYDNDDSDVPF